MANFVKHFKKINKGMTYVELVVVLGIFSMMSTVVVFNYSKFQDKIDIKNLSSEIALKIVQAQKDASNGTLPSVAQRSGLSSSWKPAYGVIFDIATPTQFVYLVDLDNSSTCNAATSTCSAPYAVGGEVSELLSITKGNTISAMSAVAPVGQSACPSLNRVSFWFTRSNSNPVINTTNSCATISYIQLTISSKKGLTSNIKVYPSGRIQIN